MRETDDSAEGHGDGAVSPSVTFADESDNLGGLHWIDLPGIVSFWALAIVVFLQFFTRYVLNDSLAWTEEVARYLLILVCFLGSVTAVRRHSHIMLEFLIRMAPRRLGKVMAVMAEMISFAFYAGLFWIGLSLVDKTRQQMVTLPVPKKYIYAICVGALLVMTIYSALNLWRKLWATPEDIMRQLDPAATEKD
ncbi:TRAP transporter small permease [Algicella marina]|uniref:TRAP transporter small permease protein n=1 Tax=Algicella marina TaxID=2683284 RepID=A0A6P1T034_9RHOB|nr:TRAP transporter small permease [Algicella marina]QHQ35367.1 TRAP transporter small permease subunit [Algicella marina]